MTVASQVKQTMASLKGTQSTLQSMAEIEQNEDTKELFNSSTARLDGIIKKIEDRVRELEYQEPQYKGF
ncbi:MAG: DUF1657 domain-containing protein [Firmicutes bacterium]|nr:DUF1657 domain-containing protein [Bacillota bacterium]